MGSLDHHIKLLEFALMVVSRLEKLSVDSLWARRASGTRRELVRLIEKMQTHLNENHEDEDSILTVTARLEKAIEWGLELLKNAAKEIPDTDLSRRG